jgi:serine phosphatase RsbU (regulator of sigma subunit)
VINRFLFFAFILTFQSSPALNLDSLRIELKKPKLVDSTKILTYYELGWEYIYINSDSTLFFGNKALELANKLKNENLIGKVYNLFGACYQIKGNYSKALDYYQKNLRIGEKNNNTSILSSYGNIGAIYMELHDQKKAMIYQRKSLLMAQRLGDEEKMAVVYSNLNNIYNNLNQFNQALDYGLKGLILYKKQNNQSGVASVSGNIGNSYLGLKQIDKALEYFKNCYSISNALGNKYEKTRACIDISSVYNEKKDYSKSIFFLKEAEILAKNNDDLTQLQSVYNALFECYKKVNNPQLALKYLENFLKLRNTLDESAKNNEINKKLMEYEFSKKNQIDSTKNANSRKISDAQIKAGKAQIEKDKILKMSLLVGLIFVAGFGLLIFSRFRIIRKQKHIIELKNHQTEKQKHIIENKNKEILDSINYAKRIQDGLLGNKNIINQNILPENYFIYFKPKDIVSGDYYWSTNVFNNKNEELFYLACCDSTGHGVPGAFMSLLNMALLSEAIKEKDIFEPNKVFNHIRTRLVETIGHDGQKDGFDGTLLCFNKTLKSITYASANTLPLLISNGKLTETHHDKMPVGYGEKKNDFSLFTLNYLAGDTLYLSTDGFADQFGGPKGKKFKYRQLNDLLVNISSSNLQNQPEMLAQAFEQWRGNLEQIDDVCIIGICL